MKTLLYISLLFFSINCFGQTETKEDFLNEVYKQILDTSKAIYLSDTTSRFSTDKHDWDLFKENFKKTVEINSINEIVKSVLIDKIDEKWNCKLFTWSKCLYYKDFPFHKYTSVKYIHFITKPYFDNLHKYAVIQDIAICGADCGYRKCYLFQKINGHWEKINLWRYGIF